MADQQPRQRRCGARRPDPWLIISRGSNMPFVLVLLGVLGGAVAFGFIGAFLGPTLLAIGCALLSDWGKEPAQAEVAARQRGARLAGPRRVKSRIAWSRRSATARQVVGSTRRGG